MNTNAKAEPVTGQLGPRQTEAIAGPSEEIGPPMQQFYCQVCNGKFFDMKHYFYDTVSTRCLWCEKYKKVAKKEKEGTK